MWKEAILGYNTSQHGTCEEMLLVKKIAGSLKAQKTHSPGPFAVPTYP